MSADDFTKGCRRAVTALATAVDELEARAPDADVLKNASTRGLFTPGEEADLQSWFARLLNIRSELWEVVGDVSGAVDGGVQRITGTQEWRCFVLGYSAACLIVQIDRLLLEGAACDSLTERKLNEGSAVHRIPRKLYNFDFDFSRSERLVCTEVVYRAYEGLGPIKIPLRERSGRPTLSAEDLLDLAVGGHGFDPVAVFGGPTCPDSLVEGEQARDAMREKT